MAHVFVTGTKFSSFLMRVRGGGVRGRFLGERSGGEELDQVNLKRWKGEKGGNFELRKVDNDMEWKFCFVFKETGFIVTRSYDMIEN